MPQPNFRYPYFNVVSSSTQANEASLYLYGYIGQEKNPWVEDDPTEPLTDLVISQTIEELEQQGYQTLNVRINSLGGSIKHGDAIINALRRTSMKVKGWNDGICASMAAQIWLSIEERYMAKNGKFMVHCAEGGVWGNSKKMRNEANTLDVFDSALVETMAEAMGQTPEQIKAEYFDGNDHWFNAASCKELGLITGTADYEGQPVPEGVEKMNYRDLMQYYSNSNPAKNKRSGGFLENATNTIRSLFRLPEQEPTTTAAAHADPPTPAAIQELIQQSTTMDINELKNSVAKGEITPDQIADYLNANGYQVEKKPDTGDRIAALEKSLPEVVSAAVAEALKNFGAAPGASATRVAATDRSNEEGKVESEYEKFERELREGAVKGERLNIVG